jgi:hypothetical protein
MKTRNFARMAGYVLANDRDEYLAVSWITPHSSLIGWALLPQLARLFPSPEDAAVLAIAIRRYDLRVCALLETESQWIVEEVKDVSA